MASDSKKTDAVTPDDVSSAVARPALSTEDRIAALLKEAEGKAPPALAEWIKKAAPVLVPFVSATIFVFNLVGPLYFKAAYLLYAFLAALPWNLLQMTLGIGLCFFGGGYCASIAACAIWTNPRAPCLLASPLGTPPISPRAGSDAVVRLSSR